MCICVTPRVQGALQSVVLGKVQLKGGLVAFLCVVPQLLPFLKTLIGMAAPSSVHKARRVHAGAEVAEWSQL